MRDIGFVASVFAAFLMQVAVVRAEEPALYYILDGSGSMWARVSDRTKIEAAKDIMSQLLRETPPGVHSGLTVYGHRRRGDCLDIEEVLPLGAIDKDTAVRKVRGIMPKGMTPISASVRFAAERLRGREGSATIVLVSDGIETCNQDPCAVIAELKADGFKFIMHVVGFGVRDDAAAQLACIAQKGGGRYFTAADAAELFGALNEVKQSVVEQKPIPASTATPTPTPTAEPIAQQLTAKTQSIRIKARGPARIELEPDAWVKAPYRWKLIDPESGVEKAAFDTLDQQVVEPGEYQLVWRQSEHGASDVALGEVFNAAAGAAVKIPLRTGIELILPAWAKAPYLWMLKDISTGQEAAVFRGTLGPQLVPSGDFELAWRQTEHGSQEVVLARVSIVPDILNHVKCATAVNPVPADWLPQEVYMWSLVDPATGRPAAQYRDRFGPQLVNPGSYALLYRRFEHASSDSRLGVFAIEPDKMNEIMLNTGIKLVPQEGLKPPWRVEFIRLVDGVESGAVWLSGSFGPMPLEAGTYKIRYQQSEHGAAPLTLVDSLELPAGSLVEIEM